MIEFNTRLDMLDWLPKGIRCAEIGVRKGAFSQQIVNMVSPKILWLVDAWKHIAGEYEQDPSNVSDEEHLKNYQQVLEVFHRKRGTAVFKAMSVDFANVVWDDSFDFVYLDASHIKKDFEADLAAWYPKVRSGGILAGHDYRDPTEDKPYIQVKSAVDEFLLANGLELEFITKEQFPSWGARKP